MTVNKNFKVVSAFGKDSFIHNTIEPVSIEYKYDNGKMVEISEIDTIREVLTGKAIEIKN